MVQPAGNGNIERRRTWQEGLAHGGGGCHYPTHRPGVTATTLASQHTATEGLLKDLNKKRGHLSLSTVGPSATRWNSSPCLL